MVAFNTVWCAVAGMVQAWVVRRGLSRWPEHAAPSLVKEDAAPPPSTSTSPRLDGRAVIGNRGSRVRGPHGHHPTGRAGGRRPWLVVVWLLARAELRALLQALGLVVPLALSTLGFGLFGGVAVPMVVARTVRVSLIIFVAVWLRSAAGPAGIRDTSMRAMRHLRWAPTLALGSRILGESAGASDFAGSVRRLGDGIGVTSKRPRKVLAATLDWVAEESDRTRDRSSDEHAVRWALRETLLVVSALGLAAAVVALVVG